MTGTSAVLALQTESLLGLLQRGAAVDCEREREAGQTRAAEKLRAARRAARRLVHQAVQDERSRRDETLLRARAAADTGRRQIAQGTAGRAVQDGWQRLPGVLTATWQDASARGAWCRAAIRAAARVLQPQHWEIRGAAPVDARELQQLRDLALAAGVLEVMAVAGDAVGAGLAICSAGATFDATLAGLLSAREVIESDLHAAWLEESLP